MTGKIVLRTLLLTVLLTALKFPVSAQGTDSPSFRIFPGLAVGWIDANSNLDGLQDKYGSSNIRTMLVDAGEGEKAKVSVLFPGTDKELTVFWKDTVNMSRPMFVTISGKNSAWAMASGIHCGTGLEELIKLNNGDLTITGCCFDYPYAVIDWNQGKLAVMNEQRMYIRLTPERETDGLKAKIIGDRNYSTTDPLILSAGFYVSYMIIWF